MLLVKVGSLMAFSSQCFVANEAQHLYNFYFTTGSEEQEDYRQRGVTAYIRDFNTQQAYAS